MIQIIKHGNIPVYYGTCSRCGCQVSCQTEDLLRDNSTSGTQMFVYCPDCGEKIIITDAFIPAGFGTTV